MKVKARFVVLAAVAAAFMFGALLALRSEAVAGKPAANIPLAASFRENITPLYSADKILGDGKGPYVSGVASAGSVEAYLVSPNVRQGGNFYMNLNNEGNEALGRTVGFLFDQWVYSCTIDSRKDSDLYKDFATGPGSPVIKPRWVQFRTYFTFKLDPADGKYKEGEEVLNFATMGVNGNPTLAYVGMSMYFRVTLGGGIVSDEYYMGFRWDPVEVQALNVGPNGPTEWIIRPIQDPDVYSNIYQKPYVPTRMLLQIHYPTGQKKPVGYQSQCYGLYNMPFELHLARMQ